ncbi:unnamed protein product [Brassica oleracea]|uniref:(rape) hypothetical protein n=1 Tax=Brassica napus TaxID=3708 RepID=A0A816I279_BRANA|nr:unnamed protein product [Brassica napus]
MVGEISEVLRCLVTCMTSYDYALENFNSSFLRLISDVSYEEQDDPDGGLERRGLSGDS